MPNISDFQKSQKPSKKATVGKSSETNKSAEASGSGEKRRPGRSGEVKTNIKIVEVEAMADHSNDGDNQSNSEAGSSQAKAASSDSTENSQKIEINFPGSELIRANFPKTFKTAEAVVTDWVNDGKFEDIPAVKHPLAKAAIQQGLIKAKELEKKVMASPVTEKVTMQAFTYAMKAQNLVKELRAKVNKK